MRDRVQTSLWLDIDVKRLIDYYGLNLSKWVNENLRRYFSVSSIEEIEKKISKLESEITILQQKKENLLKAGESKTKDEAIQKEAWQELKRRYKARREQGIDEGFDDYWITGKSQMDLVSVMRMTPKQVLDKLREWYRGM